MKKGARTAVYDDELRIEAYRFEGIVQPFPNHFHAYYVNGLVESGARRLACKNREYSIQRGDILLFNPGDNHACGRCTNRFSKFIGLAPGAYRDIFSERDGNIDGE